LTLLKQSLLGSIYIQLGLFCLLEMIFFAIGVLVVKSYFKKNSYRKHIKTSTLKKMLVLTSNKLAYSGTTTWTVSWYSTISLSLTLPKHLDRYDIVPDK